MNTQEVVALESLIATAKTLAVAGGLLQEHIAIAENWLYANFCKDCKNQIKNLETGEDKVCECMAYSALLGKIGLV